MMPKVGERVALRGVRSQYVGPANRGVVESAPAPGMRRVRWDDGTASDVFENEIRAEAQS